MNSQNTNEFSLVSDIYNDNLERNIDGNDTKTTIVTVKKKYYTKKENPQKRGPKPKLTDEDREERKKNLLQYHRQYYKDNQEDLKTKSYNNHNDTLEKLREYRLQNDPNFKPRNRKRVVLDKYINKDN